MNERDIIETPENYGLNPSFVRRVQRRQKRDDRSRRAQIRDHNRLKRRIMRYARPIGPELPPKGNRISGIPAWVSDQINAFCRHNNVLVTDVMSRRRDRGLPRLRGELYYNIKIVGDARGGRISSPMIGKWFGRDHSTVLTAVMRHVEQIEADNPFGNYGKEPGR